MKKIALLEIGCLLMAAPAAAQAPEVPPRVSVSVSGGVADIRGGGLVVGNREPALAGRVTIGLNRWVSLDVEGSVTGETTSRDYNRRADWQWREVRREITAAAYARVHVWSHDWIAVEPVAGAGVIRPRVEGWQRHYNPLVNQYSEWSRGLSGQFGYGGFYAPYDLGVFAFGVDVPIGTRRIAVVPEVRTYVPFHESGGARSDGGVHTRIAVGFRAGF